ncbi:hypothetical protein [Peptostreptococcus faecalis]|uniref:hypothetical protein n=1 Tax=Peptostreptococcus faecalis TaxID=2045015 RepID=UPI000C7979E8|nr:hypothetical protein [Peptostreptococcus faecalis]
MILKKINNGRDNKIEKNTDLQECLDEKVDLEELNIIMILNNDEKKEYLKENMYQEDFIMIKERKFKIINYEQSFFSTKYYLRLDIKDFLTLEENNYLELIDAIEFLNSIFR